MPAPVFRKPVTPPAPAPAPVAEPKPAPIVVPRDKDTPFVSAKGHKQLDDEAIMEYGAHWKKPMKEVPAQYLLFLWVEGYKDYVNEDSKRGAVARYTQANMSALMQECPDMIID